MSNINIVLQSDSSNLLKTIIYTIIHAIIALARAFYSFKNLSVVCSVLNLWQKCQSKHYFDRIA